MANTLRTDGRTDDGPTTDEKIGRKKFGRKNSDEKIRTKKNWGQGTGARHGRCGGKARVINGDSWGAKPPRPPPGGKARVTEIPEGCFAPADPPTTTFQKKKTSASTVVDATFGRKIPPRYRRPGHNCSWLDGWKIRARARRYNVNVPNVR